MIITYDQWVKIGQSAEYINNEQQPGFSTTEGIVSCPKCGQSEKNNFSENNGTKRCLKCQHKWKVDCKQQVPIDL